MAIDIDMDRCPSRDLVTTRICGFDMMTIARFAKMADRSIQTVRHFALGQSAGERGMATAIQGNNMYLLRSDLYGYPILGRGRPSEPIVTHPRMGKGSFCPECTLFARGRAEHPCLPARLAAIDNQMWTIVSENLQSDDPHPLADGSYEVDYHSPSILGALLTPEQTALVTSPEAEEYRRHPEQLYLLTGDTSGDPSQL